MALADLSSIHWWHRRFGGCAGSLWAMTTPGCCNTVVGYLVQVAVELLP
jgi:hypothetical protein